MWRINVGFYCRCGANSAGSLRARFRASSRLVGANEDRRINPVAIQARVPVQVRAGRATCRTHLAENAAAGDFLTHGRRQWLTGGRTC